MSVNKQTIAPLCAITLIYVSYFVILHPVHLSVLMPSPSFISKGIKILKLSLYRFPIRTICKSLFSGIC